MKLSEFIYQYNFCPICNKKIDITLNIDLIKRNFNYIKTSSQYDTIIEFSKIKEYTAYYPSSVDEILETQYMPTSFQIKDHIDFPKEINIINDPLYVNASLKIECVYNDFLCNSTNFNILDKNQTVNISSEGFDFNKIIIFNNYETKKTIVRMIGKFDNSKEFDLIPLDKWYIKDKIKMKEKIDKLLVLI